MRLPLLLSLIFLSILSAAQTPGLIVKPAGTGRPVLDPNGDNYVSADNTGFVSNDQTESEIPYVHLVLPQGEPTSDVATGPSCGFSDFVDNAAFYQSAYTALVSGNWLFRFRLGDYATNSKGYSILIDTDNLFGNTGSTKDPNYVTGNPGFEIEIILVTNFGVRLYDVDGTTSPTLKTTLAYDDYSQKAVALSTNCSTPDYFYDFYIPFSVITTYFPSITAATPVRLAANTVINTQSAIQAGPSDVAGINDATYAGNYSNVWTTLVNAAVPTAPNAFSTGFPPVRSSTPTVNSPLSVGGTTVSGTSAEANGTTITVYVNNIAVGTTTVTGGVWTLSGISPLALSATINATATATAKSVSFLSNTVTVGATCSAVPTISCSSNKGITGAGPAGAATGTTIRVYGPNNPATVIATVTTDATNAYLYNCTGGTTCSGGGANCIAAGIYWVTAQEAGKCESPKTVSVCIGTSGTTATPVITTNPILATTTTLSGTAVSGSTVLLYVDGYLKTSATATGGAWSFAGQSLALGQAISVYAIQTGSCVSAAATRNVTETSTAPVVTGPIVLGATAVSGTSIEAQGTVITVYKNGTSAGTTTVDANGNWTLTGMAALAAADQIRATATAPGEAVSALSNTITVSSRTTAPTITGSYTEGAMAVSGTSSAASGSTITLYVDGVSIGTTTVALSLWTVSGIPATELYAGAKLTATATESGKAESLPSASVTVSCATPLPSLDISLGSSTICINTTASVSVLLSQSNVIYTLHNLAGTTALGPSMLGTGGTVTMQSFRLTSAQSFAVKAIKIPNTACSSTLASTVSVTVTQPSDVSGVASGDYYWTGSTLDSYWTNDDNWIKSNGVSFDIATTPPSATDNVIIKPVATCIGNQPSVITSATATIPAICKNLTIAAGASLVMENTAANRTITLTGNWYNAGTFTPNNGTIRFAGSGTQTIGKASGAETFNAVLIETGATVQPLLDVSTSTLNLNGGVLDVNGHKLSVTGTAPTAIVRASPGYVRTESQNGAGELLWTINNNTGSNYVFPLGNASGTYIPVTLNLTSGNIGIAGVNSVFAGQTLSSSWPTGTEAVTSVATPTQAIKRYWHLSSNQAANSYNATITFSFAPGEDPTATILDVSTNGIKMQRWSGTSWNDALASQSFSAASPRTVTVPGITQFSWWSGGNTNQNPLPVQLLYFDGLYRDGECVLEWATATEVNSNFFTIEHSTDGIAFTPVEDIPAAGTSRTKKTYSFVHHAPATGTNYYRLKQTDTDGLWSYHNIVAINTSDAAIAVAVFPNPSAGHVPVLRFHSLQPHRTTISVYDVRGFRHSDYTADIKNNTSLEIPGFSKIPVGPFFIKIEIPGEAPIVVKLLKSE